MAGKKGDGEAVADAKGGRKKMIAIGAAAAVLLAGGSGGGVWFLTKDASAATAAHAEEELTPGEVVALESVSLNLADEGGEQHYLKLGIALQAVASEGGGHGGSGGPDGSKALDLAISEFSGLPMEELRKPEVRDHHKAELEHKIVEAYTEETDGEEHKTVMGIYFTQFVMQ